MYKIFDFKDSVLYALCFLLIVDLWNTLLFFGSNILKLQITKAQVLSNSAVCPPYFQDCLSLYVFDVPPDGYSQNIVLAGIGGLVFLALFFLYTRDFVRFSYCIAIPLFCKILIVYFLTYLVPGNYNVLGIFFGLILLFSIHKIFFLRILMVSFYLCASVLKVHSGYLTGTVFSSLALGLPLVPDIVLPYVGIIFLLICIIPPLCLLAPSKRIRLVALFILTVFHVYSASVVGQRYVVLVLPILWLLFYFKEESFVCNKQYLKDWGGIIIISCMLLLQCLPLFIQGDERLTGEGYRYGYYMYDGNHQCVSTKKIVLDNGEIRNLVWENKKAMFACDPYEEWYKIKRWCDLEKVRNIEWTYDHSLNGAPYRRIVDVKNACELTYHPFSHNEWIREDGATIDKKVIKNSF